MCLIQQLDEERSKMLFCLHQFTAGSQSWTRCPFADGRLQGVTYYFLQIFANYIMSIFLRCSDGLWQCIDPTVFTCSIMDVCNDDNNLYAWRCCMMISLKIQHGSWLQQEQRGVKKWRCCHRSLPTFLWSCAWSPRDPLSVRPLKHTTCRW